MESRHDLATSALETLPITVAIIDDDGEILLTNRSWREFGPGEQSDDHVGVDYLATTATGDDEYAREALTGIEAVLAGERKAFSMEYPCHSPDEKRWFLMRVNRFHRGDERLASLVHLEITERKLAEIAAAENARELRDERRALEHVLERVDGLVRNVTDAAVSAGTRAEIERDVCRRLVETDPYVLAWIGRVDVTNRRLSPREWASNENVPLEDDEIVLDADDTHPAVRALSEGGTQIIQNVASFDGAGRLWPTGAGEQFQSVAALPLTYGDVTYGVLVVFAGEPDVFDERELLVLESLSGTVATAMNALETRRMLTSETIVAVEVTIEDPSLFVTNLSNEFNAAIDYRGQTHARDGSPLVFLIVDRELTDDETDAIEHDREIAVLSDTEDSTVLEVSDPDGLITTLSEHGGIIRECTVSDGIADLAIELPDGRSARSVYDLLDQRYDRVELVSYHEREEPAQTPRGMTTRLESSLTDRQLTALRTAYYANYFEWPRDVTGEEVAASMDITRSTFHQHLRTAQRKLLDELFE
ncbi:bacterio-opsin activator domain-containing protein [Natrinema halophilum]|uniref:Helix-turn-helix domain-containing protein n=1 Tax=Natrinema halophilum TaxID=1699371 RepID=A0A7D5KJW6_9EURY|nr:bacterio-opsin activator domain-containing protein [Natrinema halophilum]QLG48538.1 helix-turn-helix domain-containing protein [Natrinema halophilum]